ncbi:uncharacterized protein K452DRAFT_313597 [Aplosporella prunicola CBS 121167]|uniref:Cyclin N-terminal domain-containing protein n=1 Tax=Aplosporella prunicola CBS 121167 TaxID=1176127 RepID=A0A6A6AWI3_9PEZI|nr:uncharacterized protein K452DRAFT_313597 [Aplosporella prunicola CBS 121167]KAF2135956.1 hypothetical protein K452DRAFT_313597 [Aplosporella prunicola CBS 121167]
MGCNFPFLSQDASHPYTSSLSSSASSSSSSVFSVDTASSQASLSSTTSSLPRAWDCRQAEGCPAVSEAFPQNGSVPPQLPSWCQSQTSLPPLRTVDVPVPPELRQNSRRCSVTVNRRAPPALVRQSERTVKFVDSLVDSATQMVEIIWPLSVPTCRTEATSGRGVLPLRTFIQETLRRSRTSYSTLQVALYYLILIKAHVPKYDFTMEQPEDQSLRALQCGRRMFLAALILASKYLQDRNYSARAWSKISGLKVCEINTNEMAFLKAVNWKLHITDPVFERWQAIVLRAAPSSQPPPSPGAPQLRYGLDEWKTLIPLLTPELDTVDIIRKNSAHLCIPRQLTPPASAVASSARDAWGTNVQIPRAIATPFFLEPTVDNAPPAPLLARLGPLPTPQMTPQTNVTSTPAASVMTAGPRRPSMCAAMAQHQSAMSTRCNLDQWTPTPRFNGLEAYQMSGRRPSLAMSSTSSSSSPESMISDNSSRSSRASSISSVSSAAWAPNNAKLARLATCRNAKLPYLAQQKDAEMTEYTTLDSIPSPGLGSFRINDASEARCLANQSDEVSPRTIKIDDIPKGRKRCRSSVDLSLQHNVRSLLRDNAAAETLLLLDNCKPEQVSSSSVLPDCSLASSFMVHTPTGMIPTSGLNANVSQSPYYAMTEVRHPVEKDFGRKRACCASEVAQALRRRSGPGMWEGIF